MALSVFEQVATLFVFAIGLYAGIGFLLSFAFLAIGVSRLDPQARGTGVFFRLLLLPGCIAFWPVLVRRWFAGTSDLPAQKVFHR
jgi:hypothetical protein